MISAYFSLMLRGIWKAEALENYVLVGERNCGERNACQIGSFEQPQQSQLAVKRERLGNSVDVLGVDSETVDEEVETMD